MRKYFKDWKDAALCITMYAAFTIGWLLVIINFFYPPLGEVANATLYILGLSLIYAGSVLGLSTYVKTRLDNFEQRNLR